MEKTEALELIEGQGEKRRDSGLKERTENKAPRQTEGTSEFAQCGECIAKISKENSSPASLKSTL